MREEPTQSEPTRLEKNRLDKWKAWLAASGGEDAFYDLVAQAESLDKIAERARVTTPAIHEWLNEDRDRRRGRLRDARRDSADVLAEMALDPLVKLQDDPDLTAPRVGAATSLSNFYKWMAGVRDRETYGEQKGAAVSLNMDFGSLFVQALAASQGPAVQQLGPVVEAELLLPAGQQEEEEDET
jgi:hypothetical protein